MKGKTKYRVNQYPEVDSLPAYAMTVAEYCKDKGISTSVFYMRLKRGTANYKIVVFQNINFVVSL